MAARQPTMHAIPLTDAHSLLAPLSETQFPQHSPRGRNAEGHVI